MRRRPNKSLASAAPRAGTHHRLHVTVGRRLAWSSEDQDDDDPPSDVPRCQSILIHAKTKSSGAVFSFMDMQFLCSLHRKIVERDRG
eukprot:COSAG02_NODE_5574_length_4220_cov_12.097792_6_plen_87_part_00